MSNTKLINIAKNFQSSVNIAYDLHEENKIKNFIPTTEALELFEDIFNSINTNSSKRSRIIIGAYGKGKSHIILEILNILFEKNKKLFTSFLDKLEQYNPGLKEDVLNYFDSDKKILPIIIGGSSTSLSQSFLTALYNTLKQNDFADLMPDTNYSAAINTINKWQTEFPNTYKEFSKLINIKVSDFIERLNNYDPETYSDFIYLYPKLTSGSEFNPFSGFDIVELYESVNEKLINSGKGYIGLYVIYDEFSKYLESSINKASINDIKLLQDFAEKCCRSEKKQMHLLLISHKEISNYIDILPKEKVDGWKGVSERFSHIILQSDYAQTYEIINNVIKKDKENWENFSTKNKTFFDDVTKTQTFKKVFVNSNENEIKNIVEGCYPLHPITSYILPRFSEKIAQNERTMFTFLSSNEKKTLPSFIKNIDFETSNGIVFITPDLLYDYFENQMRAEPYTSPIKNYYNISKKILAELEDNSLESKIIKTLTLIYCLNQFERLQPTDQVIKDIYVNSGYSLKDIAAALSKLQYENNSLYLCRSNDYLQLKEGSKIDIAALISDKIEKQKNLISDIDILNSINTERFLYPVVYNTYNEMTRYFEFKFISDVDLFNTTGTFTFEANTNADGIILGVIPTKHEITEIEKNIEANSKNNILTVFTVPTKKVSISKDLRKLKALQVLKEEYKTDSILFDELDLIEQDLREIISNYISNFTHPEFGKTVYYSKGKKQQLYRKANFTHLLSSLCDEVYTKTPIINNEPLNKNELTAAAKKSRAILIDAIINSQEANLGIVGGQELSFKRSSLVVTKILNENNNSKYFDIESENIDKNYRNLFKSINDFIDKAKDKPSNFEPLISKLTNKTNHIGLRKGVIPIYLAVIISRILNNVVIKDQTSELKINSDTICNCIENPKDYTISIVAWSKEKENYIAKLEKLFADFLIKENKPVGYNYILNAIVEWMRELPKYSKDYNSNVPTEFKSFLTLLKTPGIGAQEILFNQAKNIFSSDDYSNVVYHKIEEFKKYYDGILNQLEDKLIIKTKEKLGKSNDRDTLCNCGQKFIKTLDEHITEHRFENHAENLYKVLALCGNNENKLIKSLALTITGINTVDWSENTIEIYDKQLTEYIETLRNYKYTNPENGFIMEDTTTSASAGTYFINFVDENGNVKKRNFNKMTCSKKAGVLESELLNILDEYGQSINDNEKRQVLINILEELSK